MLMFGCGKHSAEEYPTHLIDCPVCAKTPTHLIYHANCFDGFGAAFACWLRYGDAVTYLPVNHGVPRPELPSGARIVMVDFSYKRSVLEQMWREVDSLLVLDHHKTAQEDLAGLPYATFDLDHSGAMLSWGHFHPTEQAPLFFRYLEDFDLYRMRLPLCELIHIGLSGYPFDFQGWHDIMDPLRTRKVLGYVANEEIYVNKLASEGVIAKRHRDLAVKLMCENAVIRKIGGYPVPVVNASTHFGETAKELARTHPTAAFAAYYLDRSDGKRQWGLRSVHGFDVSKVAKLYGGGGHHGAAGFETAYGAFPEGFGV